MIHSKISRKLLAVGAIAVLMGLASCSSTTSTTPPTPSTDTSKYIMTALVSDTAGYGAGIINPTLANAWGISIGPTGTFWLSSNHGGVTNVLNGLGVPSGLDPVSIPSRNGTDPGAPTGVVYNGTGDFGGNLFIYAGEDGILAGWLLADGKAATKLATDASADAVYKGLAVVNDGTANYLYVADFKQAKVTVYDKNFAVTGKTLTDPSPVSGYAPFNIAVIGGKIYVAYAKQLGPDNEDDQAGGGNGYINVFNIDGTGGKRFASNGVLNSPWGMTQAPASFGGFSNAILVGNFGDGAINAFDASGNLIGPMNDASGKAIKIPGLWGLMSFGTAINGVVIPNSVYFTAGPSDEDHGLFGYIKMQ